VIVLGTPIYFAWKHKGREKLLMYLSKPVAMETGSSTLLETTATTVETSSECSFSDVRNVCSITVKDALLTKDADSSS
jgi:hypothetical protein